MKTNVYGVALGFLALVGLGVCSARADTYMFLETSVMRPATAPEQTGPSGEVRDTRRPEFAWDAVEHAVWYRVYVQRVGEGAVLDAWTQDTTLTPSADLAVGDYRWWIVAWGPDGLSPWSGAMDFSIPANMPGTITLIDPQGAQDGYDLTYRWEQDEHATWYRLWVGQVGVGTWHDGWHAFSGTGTAEVELAGHPGGDFTWWIHPWGPDGFGPWSGPGAFSTVDPAPAEPMLVSPVGETGIPVLLEYESARAEWFRVLVMRGGAVVHDAWTQDTSMGLGELAVGSYAWWVGAWNAAAGRVVWSDRGNFVIQDTISGPTFVTLSGVNTYFDFDTGQITQDTNAADLRFWAHSYGGEFIMHSFNNISGTRFRPDSGEVANDPEYAYHYFRTLRESDWREAEDYAQEGRIARNDTFLLRTTEGRFVKVFIIDVRGHFNHDDRPAVDFVYQFMDQVDHEPPVLESITVVTVDGEEVSRPLADIIEFDLESEPEFLRLAFNEIVYRNRGLVQQQEGSPFSPNVWWSYPYPQYYLRPPRLSDTFSGRLWITPAFGTITLEAGEDFSGFEGDNWTDKGFYFSDLAGNRWVDLPFSKIIIRFEMED